MPLGALLLHGGSNLEGVTLMNASQAMSAGGSSRRNSSWLDDGTTDSSMLVQQKRLQVYSDTWLFDLHKNRWQLLANSSTPIPLMRHSGTVHVQPEFGVLQVVLFGGTTIYGEGRRMQAASMSDLMLLDLSAEKPEWHVVRINTTQAGTVSSAVDSPNSGICSVPGTSNLLLRRQKVSMLCLLPTSTHVS
jgi:hypothetical protein